LARSRPTNGDQIDVQKLGEEGEACAQCGTKLATDQRYCLNCGTSRSEPRLDFERALAPPNGSGGSRGGQAQAAQWTPLAAVVAIAVLAGMLLLGVLIGQGDNEVTVTEVQQTEASGSATTETEATTTAPTTTTETTPTDSTTPTTETDSGSGGAADNSAGGAGGVRAPRD
jgi:hypothetical protein